MRRPKNLTRAKQRAWTVISQYIRQKYAKNGIVQCITCGSTARWQEMHAGHYQHGLTYCEHEDGFCVLEENIHPQCPGCNTYRGGMLDKYTIYMIDTYGREIIDELMGLRHKPLKMRLDDYWNLEQEYKQKCESF